MRGRSGRHDSRGSTARGARFAGDGDACARRGAEQNREEGGKEADRWGPAGDFYFLLFSFFSRAVTLIKFSLVQR